MKFRAGVQGLSVAAGFDAVLDKDAIVAITDDHTIDLAGADDIVLGRVLVPAKTIDGEGTVETRFKELIEIKADGTINAGDPVKMSSASTGQRVKAWVFGDKDTNGDSPASLFGLCWFGGTNGQTVEILTF